MNTSIVKINEGENITCQVNYTLSFRPLIAYLRSRLKTEHTMKAEFYRFLLEKIDKEEALNDDVDVDNLAKYKDTLELIFTILTPLMANEKDLYWAMSTPIPDRIFFSTDGFYEFFSLNREEKKKRGHIEETKEKQQLQFIYSVILKRFYNYTTIAGNEILYAYTNPKTQLTVYYNITPDTQFVEIEVDGELPELNFEMLANQMQEGTELELLKSLLPLDKFKFDGFTVITLTDVTLQHAIDGIKDALVNHTIPMKRQSEVIEEFKVTP